MVSAVSSTASTRTSSGSRVPSSSSTAPFGSSISLWRKDSSCRLFSISLLSISARPPPPPASVMVLPLSLLPHPARSGKYVFDPPLHANHLASEAYAPKCVEGSFCELRTNGVLGSGEPHVTRAADVAADGAPIEGAPSLAIPMAATTARATTHHSAASSHQNRP